MEHITASCCCNTEKKTVAAKPLPKSRATAQSALSTLLSILIAFFPKCPLCWAAYMSMFGSVSLARLPYMNWLLPVLMFFLALHIYLLFRRGRRVGYLPFGVSLVGAVILFVTRTVFPCEKWMLVSGMVFIISGSLLNSFLSKPIRIKRVNFNYF